MTVHSTHLIHCAYHKCLTVYTARIFKSLFNRTLLSCFGRYRHFRSNVDAFYAGLEHYRLLSVNNCCPEITKLGDFRMTRFIRDPRDLVVSGYFYHQNCNEKWTYVPGAQNMDFRVVNGCVPEGMKPDESYREFLARIPLEEGLMAEIQFRKHHFDSMWKWPAHDPRIRLFYYEDIMGNEKEVFRELFEFYELPEALIQIGLFFVGRYAVKPGRDFPRHVRDPRKGQWREYFTDTVSAYLEERHPGLISFLGYEQGISPGR
ncbi:MAG: sulfotransferase domain-containing protein [Acidobacteria bacterium]|nr:sulfotransferase domain-containing protein [Acidobacteriota bacterium]